MEYKVIKLTQNKETLVDTEDFDELSKYSWHAFNDCKRWRAKRSKGSKSILMARQIMGFPQEEVDHINRNTLDNRKKNLRIVNRFINAQNTKATGTWFDKKLKKWRVYLCRYGKRRYIGSYTAKQEAIRQYILARQ